MSNIPRERIDSAYYITWGHREDFDKAIEAIQEARVFVLDKHPDACDFKFILDTYKDYTDGMEDPLRPRVKISYTRYETEAEAQRRLDNIKREEEKELATYLSLKAKLESQGKI